MAVFFRFCSNLAHKINKLEAIYQQNSTVSLAACATCGTLGQTKWAQQVHSKKKGHCKQIIQ